MTESNFPTAEDIWINEDYSNDHDIPNKGQYVYCPQLPWFATKDEAEILKQQIIQDHEIVERLKNHIFMRMECKEPKEPNCIVCEGKKLLKSILEKPHE